MPVLCDTAFVCEALELNHHLQGMPLGPDSYTNICINKPADVKLSLWGIVRGWTVDINQPWRNGTLSLSPATSWLWELRAKDR